MPTHLVDILHDVAVFQHGAVWSWRCQLCPSWGHGATSEHDALLEVADHVALYCPEADQDR